MFSVILPRPSGSESEWALAFALALAFAGMDGPMDGPMEVE